MEIFIGKITTIIIQTNFKSTSYVYSALNLLSYKLDDSDYLEQIGFNPEGLITKIEIQPIVNIIELLEKTMYKYHAKAWYFFSSPNNLSKITPACHSL